MGQNLIEQPTQIIQKIWYSRLDNEVLAVNSIHLHKKINQFLLTLQAHARLIKEYNIRIPLQAFQLLRSEQMIVVTIGLMGGPSVFSVAICG